MTLYLAELRRRDDVVRDPGRFPWSLPVVRHLEHIAFATPVTFLVGENGAGKSTLLEGIAAGMGAVAAGRHQIGRDPTLGAARTFAAGFTFVRRRHAKTRLFVRAEDVFGFTQRVADDMAELAADADELGQALPEGYGRTIAVGAVAGQANALAAAYGENPDGRSHGETFLAVLRRRLVPKGLYFLDEPETPLSPSRVLALMGMVAGCVARECQFVIATHSPILLALPGATILQVEGERLVEARWEDLEHVRVTRAFLANPERVLRQVLE